MKKTRATSSYLISTLGGSSRLPGKDPGKAVISEMYKLDKMLNLKFDCYNYWLVVSKLSRVNPYYER